MNPHVAHGPRRAVLASLLTVGCLVLAACGGGGSGAGNKGTASGSKSAAAATLKVTTGNDKSLVQIANGQVTLTTRGGDIYGTADTAGYFDAKATAASGTWSVEVISLQNTDPNAKACLMARQSLDAGSAQVSVCYFAATKGVRWQNRPAGGGATDGSVAIGCGCSTQTTPLYIQLKKDGANWTGAWSTDGKTWQGALQYKSQIAFTGTYYVGVAGSSHVAGTEGTAVFAHFSGWTSPPDSSDDI